MSPSEKTYRVYCFDREHMRHDSDLITAATDEEAIAKAVAAGWSRSWIASAPPGRSVS